MIQIQGVTLNRLPFVVNNTVAVSSDGHMVVVEDRQKDSRFK